MCWWCWADVPATLEVSDARPGVRVLTVAHPARKNALDDGVLELLDRALADDAGVRCWLVRGAGEGIFSSGYDLQALGAYLPPERLPDERLGEVLDRLTSHPAPSVALVTGPAFGAGCELAMACDFRVGSQAAVFCMPPARLGVVYALKGLSRVVERVGEGPARFMFLTGRRIPSAEALRFGLVDLLADSDARATQQALELCAELAANAPLAISGMKTGFELLSRGGSTEVERLSYEQARRASFNSADAREGRLAILEKRAPTFSGR